jgi:glycosyltransferase involved in cell wall biosynthesis
VAVTESTLAEMRARYADLPASKFMLVPNGYDAELFNHFEPRPHGGSKIVITHAGTVYRTSSAKWFLDALEELPETVRSRFEIRFIGRITAEESQQFEGRKADIRLLGFMPQAEALRWIEETDFLLVTLTDAISIPGKLFEYLATRKPILALSDPGGEVDSLIRRTKAGWCVDARDREAIKQLLVDIAGQGGPGEFAPDIDMIRRYSRSEIAAEYANIMRQLVSGRVPEAAPVIS